MATVQQWATPEGVTTLATTALNSLANAALVACTVFDNSSGLYLYACFELVLASLTPTGVPYVNLYLAASLDGTNYEDNTVSATHSVAVVFPMSTAVAAKRIVSRPVLIGPFKYTPYIENKTGPAFAASGNTLKMARFDETSV